MQTSGVDGDKQKNTRAENTEEVILDPQSNTTHANQLNQPADIFVLEREKDSWAESIMVDNSASTSKTNVEGDRPPFKQPFCDRNVAELPLDPKSNVNSVSNIPEETTTPPPVSHSEKSFNNAKEQGKDATKSHDRKDHYGKPVIAELPLDPKSTVNPASHPCQDTSSSLSEQQPPRHETSIDGEKVQEKKLKYLTSSACRHPVLMEASKTILVKKIQKKLLGSRKPTQHMPTR